MTGKEDTERCTKILALLPRFIENDFTVEESAEILEHLSKCPACQAEYESMKRLLNTLEDMPSIGVPRSFKDAVMRHLPPSKEAGDS
jgi:predicted anti-sigma-YlaC factor YlaD